MTTNENEPRLLLGKDIPWNQLYGRMRVVRFSAFAQVTESGIIERPPGVPYGLLIILPWDDNAEQDLGFSEPAMLPIVHKLDFLKAWEAFHVIGIDIEGGGWEVEVIYAPENRFPHRLFRAFLPRLRFLCWPSDDDDNFIVVNRQVNRF